MSNSTFYVLVSIVIYLYIVTDIVLTLVVKLSCILTYFLEVCYIYVENSGVIM